MSGKYEVPEGSPPPAVSRSMKSMTSSTSSKIEDLETLGVPDQILDSLREFDFNGDGEIDATELAEASKVGVL